MRHHVKSPSYQTVWEQILDELASSAVLQSIFLSLFSSIRPVPSLDPSLPTRILVKSEATLLRAILGDLSPENRDLWDVVLGSAQIKDFGEGKARILVCWAAFSAKEDTDSPGKARHCVCGSNEPYGV